MMSDAVQDKRVDSVDRDPMAPPAEPKPGAVAPGSASPGSISPEAGGDFVITPEVESLTDRALAYLGCSYPVHLAGPAGTGKTTLAFHVAAKLGRPVTLMHGNDEFGSGDLVGKDSGYRKTMLVDNFISSVLKTEEDLTVKWVDNKLALACEAGHTLIYDEFNRTRPEANNALLSILEEGILSIPRKGGGYLKVHPDFRIILTSNPEEYAGTHRTQDALLDRLISIQVDHYDEQTERAITSAKSGLDDRSCHMIVALARTLREHGSSRSSPTIRACVASAKVLASLGIKADPAEERFVDIAWDLFGADAQDAVESDAPFGRDDFALLLEDIAKELPKPAAKETGRQPSRSKARRTSKSTAGKGN